MILWFLIGQIHASSSAASAGCKEDWLVVAKSENATTVEHFCFTRCTDYARVNKKKVDVLILNVENCDNCRDHLECEVPRKIVQCKCRNSLYVKIWIGLLSASGGIFIILKFMFYFIYKVRKILRQMEESDVEEGRSETLKKEKKIKKIGRISRQLSKKNPPKSYIKEIVTNRFSELPGNYSPEIDFRRASFNPSRSSLHSRRDDFLGGISIAR